MKITKKELKKTIKKELKKELKKAKKKENVKTIEKVVTTIPIQTTKEKPKSILVLTIGLAAQLIVVLELVLKILNVLKELL